MQRSRRMWASLHPRPTSAAVAAFPPHRFDETGEKTVAQRRSENDLTPDEPASTTTNSFWHETSLLRQWRNETRN